MIALTNLYATCSFVGLPFALPLSTVAIWGYDKEFRFVLAFKSEITLLLQHAVCRFHYHEVYGAMVRFLSWPLKVNLVSCCNIAPIILYSVQRKEKVADNDDEEGEGEGGRGGETSESMDTANTS